MIPNSHQLRGDAGSDDPAGPITIRESGPSERVPRLKAKKAKSLKGVVLEAWGEETLSAPLVWNLIEKMGVRWYNLVLKVSVRLQKSDKKQRVDIFLVQRIDKQVVKVFAEKLRLSTGWKVREHSKGHLHGGLRRVKYNQTSPNDAEGYGGRDFRLWSWNVNGIRGKLTLINHFIDRLGPDCITFQETKRGRGGWPLTVSDYNLLVSPADRAIPGSRGLAIAVSKLFQICPVGDPSPYWLFGKVFGGFLSQPIIVGTVYVPTRSRKKGLRPQVLRDLRNYLTKVVSHAGDSAVFITGDYNMNHQEVDRWLKGRISRREQAVRRVRMESLTGTFHRPGRAKSCIDHVLSASRWVTHCKPVVVLDGVVASDHYPISTNIVGLDMCEAEDHAEGEREYCRIDSEKLRKVVEDVPLSNIWDCLEVEEEEQEDESPDAEEAGAQVEPAKSRAGGKKIEPRNQERLYWLGGEDLESAGSGEGEEGEQSPEDPDYPISAGDPPADLNVANPAERADRPNVSDSEIDDGPSSEEEQGGPVRADLNWLNTQFVRKSHQVAEKHGIHAKRGHVGRFKLHLRSTTKRAIARLAALTKRYEDLKADDPTRPALKEKLSLAKKTCHDAMRQDRTSFWHRTVKKETSKTGGGNSRAYWAWIKSLTGKSKRSNKGSVDPVKDPRNGILLTGLEEIRKAWHTHYADLAADEAGMSKCVEHWLGLLPSENDRAELEGLNCPLTWVEICLTIKSMSTGKSPGEDQITLEFIKVCVTYDEEGQLHVEPTTPMGRCVWDLLSKVWESGEIPNDWLTSTVVSIPKTGDLTDMNNYRGISLMPVMSKLLYTLLNNRISKCLESAEVFIKEQAGFRTGEECVAQATALWEVIKRRQVDGEKTFLAFVDMRKAFDTVPHQAMLRKLSAYGVKGRVLDLISKIYEGSEFQVRGGFGLTDKIRLMRGVRQGCPLSPTLFNVFINDILESNHRDGLGVTVPGLSYLLSGLLFADDLCLIAGSESELQTMLDNTTEWADKYGMSFGLSKCNVMSIGSTAEELQQVDWTLQRGRVEVSKHYKYLGLDFHDDLCLRKMSKKRREIGLGMAQDIRFFLSSWAIPITVRVMVMKACILPILLYGSELWGMNVSFSRRHETVVNNCLRWIIGTSGSVASVMAMREEFNVAGATAEAAARRLRAFKSWGGKRTVISDLVKNPMKSRKWTWTSGCDRWCRKYGPSTPDKKPKPGSASTPNQVDAKAPSGTKLWSQAAKVKVWERQALHDKTVHFAWYNEFIKPQGGFRDWQWLCRPIPELRQEWSSLAKFRVGGVPTAKFLAHCGILDAKYKTECPFCEEGKGETLFHMVATCKAWESQRLSISDLIEDAKKIIARQPGVEGWELEHALVGLLLGGAVKGKALTSWYPLGETVKRLRRELAVDTIVPEGPGLREDVDSPQQVVEPIASLVRELTGVGAVRVAKCLYSIRRERAKRLHRDMVRGVLGHPKGAKLNRVGQSVNGSQLEDGGA